jgi:hypothetical protein
MKGKYNRNKWLRTSLLMEMLLGTLGACQSILARVYSQKFGVELEDFRVELEGDLDTDGFMNISDVRRGYSYIRYTTILNRHLRGKPQSTGRFHC